MQQLSKTFQFTFQWLLVVSACLSGCSSVNRQASIETMASPPKILHPEARASKAVLSARSLAELENVATVKPEKHPAPPLWGRLFKLYRMPPVQNEQIDREIEWYSEHTDYLEQIQLRARPFLASIIDKIEKNGLPGEIALLPVVESAFKAKAYSRVKAAGLWQFTPATGRHYGLKQNWWYDARRDVHLSTQAAISYLKKLAEQFDNDWFLVLAAYNAGEGTVGRAIEKNRRQHKPTDFWSLPLPQETRRYVPKLIAVSRIFALAHRYNMKLLDIDNRPYFQTVDIGGQLDIAKAAELAGITVDEMFELNPGLKHWATDPTGPHHLLVPSSKADMFKRNLASIPVAQRVQWQRHHIRSGDTLGEIAQTYGTTPDVLRQINGLRSNSIRAGKALLIPFSSETRSLLAANQRKSSQTRLVHEVQSGDTYWDIAQQYGVTVQDLQNWNRNKQGTGLRPGAKLTVLRDKSDTLNNSALNYIVRKGDSLYLIARRFNVSIDELKSWNSKVDPMSLRPGQVLELNLADAGSTRF